MSTPLTTSDTIMSRSGWRDYELDIIVGELYEVWLHHDWEEPKPCVPVTQIATDAISPNWEVLVDGQVKKVHAGQIFRSGTTTRPNPPFTMPIIKNMPDPASIARDCGAGIDQLTVVVVTSPAPTISNIMLGTTTSRTGILSGICRPIRSLVAPSIALARPSKT